MSATSPREIREIEHVWILLSDGVRLSARVWLPADAERRPVPAVLEYLPYRKDDATAAADARTHPYFARHGYAGVRVDLRGTGDSEGLCLDEYLRQEQDDALEVLAWIAAQPWCTGRCAMYGKSWGGFNGLQVAARRPPELAAVVTIYSTDDRYTDDCHYQGGCVLAPELLKWASWMHALNARPADPRVVGADWLDRWLDRLRGTPPYVEAWLAHQRRDAYWRHGSVDEDYAAIEAATLVVGGWADPYTNAVPRLLEHLRAPCRGIVGPWGHVAPDLGVPGPAIGFLHECVRWFDRWLGPRAEAGAPGAPDVDADPLLRVWIQDRVPPAAFVAERPGRWAAEESWPPAGVRPQTLVLGADASLREPPAAPASPAGPATLRVRGDQLCGATVGVWCPNGFPDELPVDQRPDDALGLCFDTAPLGEDVELLGRPVVRLAVSADRPQALLAARLCDVAPDGSSALVTMGLLNLTHRDGDEHPEPLVPGRCYRIALELNVIGQRVAAGHRLRLALSPTWWPQAWPSPETVTLTLDVDGPSTLELPVRTPRPGEPLAPVFAPAEPGDPRPAGIAVMGDRTQTTRRDPATGAVETEARQTSLDVIPATGMRYVETAVDRWRIVPDDPLSARVECEREITIDREDWHVRIVTTAVQTADADAFHVATTLRAWDADRLVYSDEHRSSAPRDLV